jgi:hypothetical protein
MCVDAVRHTAPRLSCYDKVQLLRTATVTLLATHDGPLCGLRAVRLIVDV